MRRSVYLKQLAVDLERWTALGLIDPKNAQAMREAAGPAERTRSLAGILAMLGVILLACAVLFFVSANWQTLPRIAKLALLLASMWGASGAGVALAARKRPALSEAALLLGSALYGATIMLIGQIYHLNAGWPNGVLLWACGTLLAAVLAPSRACSVLALILFSIWTAGETFEDHWVIHWPFLIALLVMILLARMQSFAALVHLVLLAFLGWSAINGIAFADRLNGGEFAFLIALMTVLSLSLWLIGRLADVLGGKFGGVIAGYGLFATAIAVFFIQLAESDALDASYRAVFTLTCGGLLAALAVSALALKAIAPADGAPVAFLGAAVLFNLGVGEPWPAGLPYLYAVLYLAFVSWLLIHGLRTQRGYAVNLAFVAFGAQVLYLYFVVFGTLLQQSALFAVGGVLFLAAALALERVRRHVLPATPKGA